MLHKDILTVFHNNESGVAIMLFALILPIFLLVIVLIIDGGNFYVRHAEIQNLARNSANSGLLEFIKIMRQKAAENRSIQCISEPLPAKCESGNMYHFLTLEEIENLANNTANKVLVTDNVQSFAIRYDPTLKLQTSEMMVNFPHNLVAGDTEISLQLAIETTPEQFFSTIIKNEKTIKVSADVSLQIN